MDDAEQNKRLGELIAHLDKINTAGKLLPEKIDAAEEKTVKLLVSLHAAGVGLIATLSGVFATGGIGNAKPLIWSAIPFLVGLTIAAVVSISQIGKIRTAFIKKLSPEILNEIEELVPKDHPFHRRKLTFSAKYIFRPLSWIALKAEYMLVISLCLLLIGAAMTLLAIWNIADAASSSPLCP